MYAFIHYSMNTYTDEEWGFGNEDLKLFNPSNLDCRQWVRVCKQAGMKGIIFTAKHHCGFCMWPSKYTEYSVKNTPWKQGRGDVVRELADACREEGLKFAVYLSPWDRNHKDYGKPEYVTYFRNQLRELLTQYGDIFEVWFDGANGGDGWYGGANETRKIDGKTYYGWAETFRMIRELQPHAVIWNDGGDRGDLRWVGTEAGNVGETNWSLMPGKGDTPWHMLHYGVEDGDVWCPGETNTSIRPGWFYHETENEHVKSLSKLMDTYYKSVGRNSTLLLNFPIMPNGRIHPTDSLRGIAFKKMIDEVFKTDLAKNAEKTSVVNNQYPLRTVIAFKQSTMFNRFVVEEAIRFGQRVKKFSLEAEVNGQWVPLDDELVTSRPSIQGGDGGGSLTTIGHRRIVCFPTVNATKLRFTVTDAKCEPMIKKTAVYLAPELTADIPDSGEKKSSNLHFFYGSAKQVFIDWDKEQTISAFRYLPPQTSRDGTVTHYSLWASTDWHDWKKVAQGEFSNIVNNPIWQTIKFNTPVKAKVLRLEADRLAEGDRMAFGDIEVVTAPNSGFCIAKDGKTASIVVDEQDWKGVVRAANDLSDDVRKVCGVASEVKSLTSHFSPLTSNIIVGTIGKSRIIDQLVKQKKLDVSKVKGQWESYVIDIVDGNLVVAGSDKRGTIYGIYTISEKMGVSPWYWWADVPVKHQEEMYWEDGRLVQPSPKVKYRGIFINDEWPSFGGWSTAHFGGVNSKMYAHMFELLLRLKANYLWPAMWATAFNEDDVESPRLADEYGIVMGTSHHEPMMRSHQEYLHRKEQVGSWDYATNKQRVDQFFLEGMQRNKDYDNLVTIGMRGDGDVAMGKGDDADNMKTLAEVIKGQRKIIKDIYGRADAVPQLWAIFTEVQRYYDAGFTVPDDVTLLLCDNNWGYIRRIGRDFERKRKGGLGLYYHIDMNGGPWNDRWVNTTTIPKLREQLNLAYQSGIDRIWIINVGDLKPKEVPIDFIMHYAWNPESVKAGDERAWLEQFTKSVFGAAQFSILNSQFSIYKETADIIAKYSKLNLLRKPEAQVPGIFNYEEMLRMNNQWQSLVVRCEALKEQIPAEAQDAFYQLVYYPAVASAGVGMMYNAATMGDSLTVCDLMAKDQRLTEYYNKVMANGKWDGMMRDNHIGYTQWSIPETNRHPMNLGYKVHHDLSASNNTKEYSIDANNYTRKTDGKNASWLFLPDLGRGEGCMGSSNVMAQTSGATLEYDVNLSPLLLEGVGKATIAIGILPTQDIYPARGLRLGVQIDDQPVQTIDARRGLVDTFLEYTPQNLKRSKLLKPLPPRSRLALSGFWNGRQLPRRDEVFDNLRWLDVTFSDITPGKHTLKLVMIDPEIVVEQIVVNPDNNRYSYFGR